MTTTRNAKAHWEGSLFEGKGQVDFASSGLGTYDVTWASRAEEPDGRTSPEELIAAAHASCFSMQLSNVLAKAGNEAQALDTSAEVDFKPGSGITEIRLTVRGKVEGLDNDAFVEAAESAKTGCPVSQALTGTTIKLDAALAE